MKAQFFNTFFSNHSSIDVEMVKQAHWGNTLQPLFFQLGIPVQARRCCKAMPIFLVNLGGTVRGGRFPDVMHIGPPQSMDWFKGKSTGNHGFYVFLPWNMGVSGVICPLNQSLASNGFCLSWRDSGGGWGGWKMLRIELMLCPFSVAQNNAYTIYKVRPHSYKLVYKPQ